MGIANQREKTATPADRPNDGGIILCNKTADTMVMMMIAAIAATETAILFHVVDMQFMHTPLSAALCQFSRFCYCH